MKLLAVGSKHQYDTILDDDDYAYFSQWPWSFGISHPYGSRPLVYVRRCIRVKGEKKTILLSRLILDRAGIVLPTRSHTADHRNGHTLDNRKANLRWLTPSQQVRQRGATAGWTRRTFANHLRVLLQEEKLEMMETPF